MPFSWVAGVNDDTTHLEVRGLEHGYKLIGMVYLRDFSKREGAASYSAVRCDYISHLFQAPFRRIVVLGDFIRYIGGACGPSGHSAKRAWALR